MRCARLNSSASRSLSECTTIRFRRSSSIMPPPSPQRVPQGKDCFCRRSAKPSLSRMPRVPVGELRLHARNTSAGADWHDSYREDATQESQAMMNRNLAHSLLVAAEKQPYGFLNVRGADLVREVELMA